MQVDNLKVEVSECQNAIVTLTYLIFSFITNNNKERSVFGLNTVFDECVHTRVNDLLNHVDCLVMSRRAQV